MKSLRHRLTITHTIVALLAVVLMAVLAGRLIVGAYREQAVQQARITSQRLSTLLATYYTRNGGWGDVAQVFNTRLADRQFFDQRRVILAGDDRRVLFDSAGFLPPGTPLPLRLRTQGAPVIAGGRQVGYVVVPAGSDDQTAAEREFVRSIIRIVVIGGAAGTIAALLVAWLMARRLTRPLASLTRAARNLAAGKRHEPITPPQDAELAELAYAFNTMAADLGRQEDLRRQLVADIAHELRTPLSVLRLQIESLEDGVEQPTPQTLGALGHQVTMLNRLVDDLRLLSLADAGQLALSIEPLNPGELLARTAAAAGARARQQAIDLRVETNGTLPPVCADAQRLAQILGNLVENALRYTPHGGTVTLRALLQQGASTPVVAFEVGDTGPGIAPEDLPHIFERFYRTDRARARETGGSGLGLAIVQRLVEAQGGQVSVHSTPGQGTTFTVTLPAG